MKSIILLNAVLLQLALHLYACPVTGINRCDSADSIQQRLIECTITAATDLENVNVQQSQNLDPVIMSKSQSTMNGKGALHNRKKGSAESLDAIAR